MAKLRASKQSQAIGARAWRGHLGAIRATDREIAAILRDAAKEAEKLIANNVSDSVSARVRRAQYRIALSQLTQLSAEMWGEITPAIQRGINRAIEEGIRGIIDLDSILADSVADNALRNSVIRGSELAADTVRSRLINDIKLSPKVYRTRALSQGLVSKAVNRGLALGQSADEIARSVRHLISPNVRGGVSYAARRLARTEINNAFHTSTIRLAADDPWTAGFKWVKSDSHPRPDPCDDLADDDHDGLGPGIFKPKNVPGKPHPQCLCYLLVVHVPEDEFIDKLIAGDYDEYIK